MEKQDLCGQDPDDSREAPINKDSVVCSCVNLTIINQTKKKKAFNVSRERKLCILLVKSAIGNGVVRIQ